MTATIPEAPAQRPASSLVVLEVDVNGRTERFEMTYKRFRELLTIQRDGDDLVWRIDLDKLNARGGAA